MSYRPTDVVDYERWAGDWQPPEPDEQEIERQIDRWQEDHAFGVNAKKERTAPRNAVRTALKSYTPNGCASNIHRFVTHEQARLAYEGAPPEWLRLYIFVPPECIPFAEFVDRNQLRLFEEVVR